MPNLDPWINQYENKHNTLTEQEEGNSKFEKHLLFYRDQCQNIIERNSHRHSTFLERYQKIIEMIDWTLERYRIIIQKK
jgi:hypothetical protein